MKRVDDPQATTQASFGGHDDAENQVCRAVAALGRLAGIDVDQGEGPEDIDAVLIQAAYESNFDDPHFIGGPCCFKYVEDVNAVDRLHARATSITSGLLNYIGKRADPQTVSAAGVHAVLVDNAFAWLRNTVRSA